MALNFSRLVSKYEQSYDDEPIEYIDTNSGSWEKETDPHLENISAAIQQRANPHINRTELRSIGRWKVGGDRIDRHLKDNSSDDVEIVSKDAFSSNLSPSERVDLLTDLAGVGVPVASSILTVYDPQEFAVIDFRALRALGAVEPSLTDVSNYSDYSEFVQHLLDYGDSPETYEYYMDIVDKIAVQNSIRPREVDMALWVFDKECS